MLLCKVWWRGPSEHFVHEERPAQSPLVMWTALWQPKADVNPPKNYPSLSTLQQLQAEALGPQLASDSKQCIAGQSTSPHKASGRRWRIFRLVSESLFKLFLFKVHVCMYVWVSVCRARVYVCRGACVQVCRHSLAPAHRWCSEDDRENWLSPAIFENPGLELRSSVPWTTPVPMEPPLQLYSYLQLQQND